MINLEVIQHNINIGSPMVVTSTACVQYASLLGAILEQHPQWGAAVTGRPANRTSSTPNSLYQISVAFLVSTLSARQSIVAPCSGRRRTLQAALCRWHKCTRRGSRMRRCRRSCRTALRRAQGPCGWVSQRWCRSSSPLACKTPGPSVCLGWQHPAVEGRVCEWLSLVVTTYISLIPF